MSVFIVLLGLAAGCQQTSAGKDTVARKGMIKVSVLYPSGDGNTFDMNYYSTKHFALVERVFGTALKSYSIDKGLAGGTPDAPAPYLAVGHLYFETLEDFQNALGPNAETLANDAPNYTNAQPIILISEIIQ